MADNNTTPNEPAVAPKDWRERMRAQGKEAFQLEEMRRLGFWPPAEGVEAQIEVAEREVARIDRELAPLRVELLGVEADIARLSDVQSAIDAIRRNRIERVKAERVQRRARQAIEKATRIAAAQLRAKTELPFLGHGVSSGLSKRESDAQKLALLGLPLWNSAPDVAQAMGISAPALAFLTFHRGAATVDHYHRFQIPKRRGGMRNVSAPKTRLRAAQRFVLEQVLARVPVHEAATAFAPDTSIVENAARHMGARVVVRLDLQDFFPSISFARVRSAFSCLGYSGAVSTVLALLCTESPRVLVSLDGQTRHVALGERVLPQGACTSPALSNWVCRRLDARLSGLVKRFGWTYSRYADDLIFSSSEVEADVKTLISCARSIIRDEKLVVNDEKTRVMRSNARQSVTGLVVNAQNADAPRPSRPDLRRFRAFLHAYETQGREAMTQKIGRDALAHARGVVSFLHMSQPEKARALVLKHSWLARNSESGD
jgi:RNA-directed DNA polymerase